MLNFVLCEDNLVILDKLSKMLETLFDKHNYDATIVLKSTTPEDVIKHVENNTVHVLILDINLKSNISGLDLAKKVREITKNPYIIFLTGHLEYALIAYQVKTFDYIPKPITIERLEETILRLFKDLENNKTRYIKIGNNQTFVKPDEIKYIKREGMKIIYHTNSNDYHEYSSFTKIQDELPSNFIRCHKSYIANINNINDVEINKNLILFNNDDKCFIGPKYKNKFMEVFNNYGNFSNVMDNVNHA